VETARLTVTSIESGLEVDIAFPSGARIHLASPSGESGPNPVQTVLAALAGCTAMDVIALLRKQRQGVTRYEVHLHGERRKEHPRIFTRIEIVHRVHGHDVSPSAVAEAIRLSDTKYCSVHGMLEGTAEIVSRFEILPP
jgi:putative redox protein